MSTQTNDQYLAVAQLDRWYKKYTHQFIEISGVIGTGIWEVLQEFIGNHLDPREVMYLSHNQKQVTDLAAKGWHAYYVNGIIYNYERIVDFESLPVVNRHADGNIRYTWTKRVRKKVNPQYKLMIVFDSLMMSENAIMDLGTFGLPVILVRDPMLLPAPDSHTFTRDPNIVLREVHPDYGRNPLVHFAHKIIRGEPFIPGSYDNVSIVARKQMNLYNLRSPHMNITLSEESRQMINTIYRDRIMHRRDSINVAGERIVVINSIYNERLVNEKNKRIKVYLHGPMVGTISKINRHAASTRYVPMEFKPECYDEPFIELAIDRHYLNKIQSASRQQIPDRLVQAEYAYALTPMQARLSYWDKITMLMEPDVYDPDIQARMMYTGITRAKQFATIVV